MRILLILLFALCTITSIGIAGKGLAVVGSSVSKDSNNTPTLTPTKAALQPDYAGSTDAHIILLAP